MVDFKNGDKVTVTSFKATVQGYHGATATWHVTDDEFGYNYYIFDKRLVKDLPYDDGRQYIDKDGDRVTFRATGYNGGPGWQLESGSVQDADWPARPLRPIGDEITE